MNVPQEYKMSPAYSNSDIKLFENNIREFFRQKVQLVMPFETRKDHFEVGDLTDVFLLQPDKKSLYYTITDRKATEGIQSVVKTMIELIKKKVADNEITEISKEITDYKDLILPAVKIAGFQYNKEKDKFNWKEETYVTKMIDEGSLYFKEMVSGMGKFPVSYENWVMAEKCVRDLTNDPQTGKIVALIQGSDPDIEVVTAFDLYGECNGHLLRMLGDFMLIDRKRKTIRPFDLKTSDSPMHFMKMYLMSRYIRQGSLYSYVIRQNYPDYKVEPFTFMVVYKSTEFDYAPELFEMSQEDIIAGMEGATFKSGARFKGWKELLDDIKWHKENNKWEHARNYYERSKHIIRTFNGDLDMPMLDF